MKDTKEKSKKPHDGHRKRMYERHFFDVDMDNYKPHEILEMLLYQGVPRKDTNIMAHELINTFGTLGDVLVAKPYELLKIKGMTKRSASFISMILPLARRAETEYNNKEPVYLDRLSDATVYIRPYFIGFKEERILLVSLDTSSRVIACDWLNKGISNLVVLDIRAAVETACRRSAVSVILVHNHPSGNNKPSSNDDDLTKSIVQALSGVGIALVDHIIITPTDYFSYSGSGRLSGLVSSIDSALKLKLVSESMTYRRPDGSVIDEDCEQ